MVEPAVQSTTVTGIPGLEIAFARIWQVEEAVVAIPVMGARTLVEFLAYVEESRTVGFLAAMIVARIVAEQADQEVLIVVRVRQGGGGDGKAVILLCLRWKDCGRGF